jgi:hypothetical protein
MLRFFTVPRLALNPNLILEIGSSSAADTHRQGVSRPLALELAESTEVINHLSDSLTPVKYAAHLTGQGSKIRQNVPSAVGGKCLSAVDIGIA